MSVIKNIDAEKFVQDFLDKNSDMPEFEKKKKIKFIRMYLKSKSNVELASKFGCDPKTISNNAKKLNLPPRRVGSLL